jgi:hypothetical protein
MDRSQPGVHRRSFIGALAALGAAGTIGLRAVTGVAGDESSLSSTTAGKCGTCEFWGGVRKISADGSTVTFESAVATGWCNNPKSPNYHKRTVPEMGPMPMWRKWGALG